MNNDQFRRLVLDNPSRRAGTTSARDGAALTPRKDGSSTPALGSRMRSSIPMTPRSVAGSAGVDFARQLAERNAQNQPSKKFRSSAAPKGAKLPSGYRDRTQDRTETDTDDKASRVQALEELVKLGQIDQGTFEKLRDEIVGGDVGTTHLVKGLDYKLLERVRRGEDVLNSGPARTVKESDSTEEIPSVDVEAEFEKIEAKEVAPLPKEKTVKKGKMGPPPPPPAPVAGKKRSRDEILAELKASRKAATAPKTPAPSTLGPKFRKLGEKKEQSRIERDERGREILITVDEEGRVKRKVKKINHTDNAASASSVSNLPMPDKDAKPLGMDVPQALRKTQTDEEEIDNIFDDAGSDYDPLGDVGEEDDDDDDDEGHDELSMEDGSKSSPTRRPATNGESPDPVREKKRSTSPPDVSAKLPSSTTTTTVAPRNYFSTSTTNDSTTETPSTTTHAPLTNDPTILAAIRKASKINPSILSSNQHADAIDGNGDGDDDEEAARIARRQKMLLSAAVDRDADDLDLGFGSSRLEDEEDMEDRPVKLSVWGGGGGGGGPDGGGGAGAGAGKQRKRGPKKTKKKGGDVNNAADVLKVLERRKGASG